MDLDPAMLQTLAAVVREGTFDRAATQLHVTPLPCRNGSARWSPPWVGSW